MNAMQIFFAALAAYWLFVAWKEKDSHGITMTYLCIILMKLWETQ
jgi:hypothetical protein